MDWVRVRERQPEPWEVVETKIDDAKGERNVQRLQKGDGRLWFVPDGSMYVYYEPTHWRPIRVGALRGRFARHRLQGRSNEADAASRRGDEGQQGRRS